MNDFQGIIEQVVFHEGIALVTVAVSGCLFTSVVLEDKASAPFLVEGGPIRILFNENEVILATAQELPVSVRNRIGCRIEFIEQGVLLSRLSLNASMGTIHAVITTRSVKELKLIPGMSVWALVKTTEMQLNYE